MKKHRSIVWLAAVCFAFVGVLFAAAAARAQDAADEDAFGNIMNTGFARIDSVDFNAPAAGAPCKVAVKITLAEAEDFEGMAVKSAKLTYVVNGDRAGAKAIDMTGAANVFTAEIPGQPAGAKVAFYVTIVDSLGNTSTEALPVDSKDKAPDELIAGVPDMANSKDIVPPADDILGSAIGYDQDYIYAGYDLSAPIAAGTIDPPNIQIYGIKLTNPDVDQSEGLMVGKMWVYLPLLSDKADSDKFLAVLPSQITSVIGALPKEQQDKVKASGMFVLDIAKLMGGDWNNGLIFNADTTQIPTGNDKKFVGMIKRSMMGESKSGFYRVIMFTAINAALDNFMPMPMNCSHFMQIYTRDHEYDVK